MASAVGFVNLKSARPSSFYGFSGCCYPGESRRQICLAVSLNRHLLLPAQQRASPDGNSGLTRLPSCYKWPHAQQVIISTGMLSERYIEMRMGLVSACVIIAAHRALAFCTCPGRWSPCAAGNPRRRGQGAGAGAGVNAAAGLRAVCRRLSKRPAPRVNSGAVWCLARLFIGAAPRQCARGSAHLSPRQQTVPRAASRPPSSGRSHIFTGCGTQSSSLSPLFSTRRRHRLLSSLQCPLPHPRHFNARGRCRFAAEDTFIIVAYFCPVLHNKKHSSAR